MEEDYKCKNRIAEGSFAKIYDTTLDNYVVKKIKFDSILGIMSILELYVITFINHPNVISCNLKFIEKAHIEYMMPKASYDMTKWMKKEYSLKKFKQVCFDIVKGLYELHRKNILHGDIKPNNIVFFEEEQNVKLIDFGKSIIIRNNNKLFDKNFYAKSFRAPEIYMTDSISLKADIWALGCTLYEFKFKTHFFESDILDDNFYINRINEWEQYVNSLNFEPNWIAKKWNGDNKIFKDLLINMLNVNHNNRFSIIDVINHEFFDSVRDNINLDYDLGILNNIIIPEEIYQYALTITNNKVVIEYAYQLYLKVTDNQFTLETCIYLSWKILYNTGLKSNLTYYEYNEEIRLIKYLGYNIYIP